MTLRDHMFDLGRAMPMIAAAVFALTIALVPLGMILVEQPHRYIFIFTVFGVWTVVNLKKPLLLKHLYEGLEACDPKYWIPFTITGFALIHLLSGTVLGRQLVFAFVFIHPFLALLPVFANRICGARLRDRLALGLVVLMAITLIVPGFYFPPFFNGIAGWVVEQEVSDEVRLAGYQFENERGERVWITPGVTSPTSLNWRQISAAQAAGEENLKSYLDFVFKLYDKNYPLYRQGYEPNQRYLGRFAYPGHNPYHKMPYKRFPPTEIAYITYIDEYRDRHSGKVISSRPILKYDLRARTFTTTNERSAP